MRDKNNNIVCEVCGVAAYMHSWVTNRPDECAGGAVITDEDASLAGGSGHRNDEP